jgi:prepilin-type N-terminal cleavage/methylation domain-containing protein
MIRLSTARNTGFTLLEVVIVLALFSTIMTATLMTLNSSSSIQQAQQKQTAMQSSSRQILNDIKKHLGEANLSENEVDTRMRWHFEDQWETYDKFHTWIYTKGSSGNDDYYPALVQCPERVCGWVWDGANYNRKYEKFNMNFNYQDGNGDPLFNYNLYDSFKLATEKGFSRSGRIYNNFFDPDEHSTNGFNPYSSGYNHTTAQCIKGSGARLSPLVQLDVLQFPTPRSVRDEYITNEGTGRGPDFQGWLIYAPYYDRHQERLEIRRFGLFVRDLFETFPWNGNAGPNYQPPVNGVDTIDGDVIDAADSAVPIQTDDYITDYGTYNKMEEDGSPGDRPPDWPDIDPTDGDRDPKPTLMHLFDFNGNNLIETDVDADGNDQITFGSTRPETESTIEQFRLYPSTSTVDTSRFADWSSSSDINNVNALVYHKYSDKNLRNSDDGDKYYEMEVYYFIDLSTGWTRFYYYCSWDKSNSGNDWYSINASFIREPHGAMDDSFRSHFYIPYKEFGRNFIGLDFSTSLTYPGESYDEDQDNDGNDDYPTIRGTPSGIDKEKNSVRIGIMLDEKLLIRGQYRFPSFRQETMVPLVP